MADWSGQIKDSANARGVWMRASSLIEHIPSFPGDIDELDAPSEADFSETEVTDTAHTPMRSRNRGPITDPPPPARTLAPMARSPRPAPLYDEPPDHSETTPPTWDMGLLPATYADAEVTEEQHETSVPLDLATISRSVDLARSAALDADMEASIEIELLDDWMERVDQLDIEAPRQQLLPIPTDARAPGGRAPLSSRTPIVSRGTGTAKPVVSRGAGTAQPIVSRGTGTPRPAAPRPPAPRPAAPVSAQAINRASATAPVPPVRHAATPDRYAFDSHAITRPTARPPMVPYYEPEVPSAFERAGWWAAGALSGMIGACVLASLALAAALLV